MLEMMAADGDDEARNALKWTEKDVEEYGNQIQARNQARNQAREQGVR